MKKLNLNVLNKVVNRAHYLATRMVFEANHRNNKEKGDPKVGGHVSATASAIHIMGALHLAAKTGYDHVCNKPHASPGDHAFTYLMDLQLHDDLSKLSVEESNHAMHSLRAFPQQPGEYVFQSYHSTFDPDHHNFLPSGTVGIPPVNAGYLAHAYRFAKEHGYEVPEAHFWSVMGDAEFREGSLLEAAPDFAERELGNLTWILDYNRQSLDGHRITNPKAMMGTDDTRVEKTMQANGWRVIQLRHGKKRKALFELTDGTEFQRWLEEDLPDYELQSMLLVEDPDSLKKFLSRHHPNIKGFLANVDSQQLFNALRDFGGHDLEALIEAMEESKRDPNKPVMIICHTLKGWGLDMAAQSGNHNMLTTKEEIDKLQADRGLSEHFQRFDASSAEGKFCQQRGEELYQHILGQHEVKTRNEQYFHSKTMEHGEFGNSLDINLKMASYPHTQWMLGQLTAKLTRLANTPVEESKLKKGQKALTESEKAWKLPGELIVSMAPDVGTSTNLNPSMDGKIFGTEVTEDFEAELHVKDNKTPDLVPGEDKSDRFIRFDIQESNVMSCMGSYGRLRDILGIPLIPLMTVYDFFIKRALDQYFYNLYWKSSFIMIGTPAGVTLSPEGAQHGWKSDFQIPNQITWEPFFCQELDWILSDAIHRHIHKTNEGRTGVHIRGVTRGADQKQFLKLLKTQSRFKTGLSDGQKLAPHNLEVAGAINESTVECVSDDQIWATLQQDVLAGAYHLIDYRGYASYEPGDNVVNIFALGSLATEAIKTSQELLSRGIYANVIVVTSTDLLVGNLGHENNYEHLRNGLGINADLHLQPELNDSLQAGEMVTVSGRRVPMVSVHDGEPGLLDNIGSIIGVRHEALAVRKHSKCGRPVDIYNYHGIDSEAVTEACGQVLAETALENVRVSQRLLQDTSQHEQGLADWRQLWPQVSKQ